MGSDVSIIITLSAIIFIAPYAANILKIPTIPIEIILGSLAGFFGLLSENHMFELVAEIGFFYLMFLAGAEVDLRLLLNMKKDVLKKAIIYITMLYILSFLASIYLNAGKIFIVIFPLISVGLILTLYNEFGKDNKWLNLSMTIGILGEVLSIAALTFVGTAFEFGFGPELYKSLTYLTLFLVAIIIIFKLLKILFWWYPEIKTYLVPITYDKDEKDIRLSMALFFLMIAIMLTLHLEIAFGAFIAGVFIATFFEHKADLPHKLSSFGFGFLVPIFFVYIGSTFEIESLFLSGLVNKALLITFLMIGIRVISSFVLIGTLNFKEMILFALSHSMPLTLLIAVATLAYQSNSISQLYYYSFILASLFEVIIVMISIKLIYKMAFSSNSN